MIRVQSNQPCRVVYSLYQHEYLGYLFEPHIVQLTAAGSYSLAHQKLHTKTADEFASHLDETDYRIIKILEECDQDTIIRKVAKAVQRPAEFFKTYDEKKHTLIRPTIERRIAEALTLMRGKEVFEMSKEGDPAGKKLEIASEPASVLFHFRRDEKSTRYFATIKYLGEKIEFMFKGAHIISASPAWMLLENKLLFFDENLDGKKLQPFLNKRYIEIQRSAEHNYFKKFVVPLIEKHSVYAEGFTIVTEQFEAIPLLRLAHTWTGDAQLALSFRYGSYLFPYQSGSRVSVTMEEKDGSYTFHRVRRSLSWEAAKINLLKQMGFKASDGSAFELATNTQEVVSTQNEPAPATYPLIEWLGENSEILVAAGFEIQQDQNEKNYFIGQSRIDLQISESNDWFDIRAVVQFGSIQVPFIELKNYILSGKREFLLPNGEIAIIPEKWFSQYSQLLSFAEGKEQLRLRKHHVALVRDYADNNLASVTMDRKLNRLINFEQIEEVELPKYFNGELRPYQKAGYDWFHFLRKFNFGGCLADDMGLGKTIQTLALLQKVKEDHALSVDAVQKLGQGNLFDVTFAPQPLTSLIVMPTSLVHNWVSEARKFTPQLRMMVHTGVDRSKDVSQFANYDVVIATYGVIRIDSEELKKFYFHYIILDESQAIKNPSSKTAHAVKTLKSKYRLALTGTPVENSVMDLWSQMSFLNPGLLGNQTFFSDRYVTPIEKKKDEEKATKLQALIKPFVLRRTKKQVAEELPEKVEHLYYSEMTEEQEKVYEETKSFYRNEILRLITTEGKSKAQLPLLQGLTKLRQIANHPLLVNASYSGDSGKFSDVIITIENTLAEGHRILVFSQFVKHLSIFRKHLDEKAISYAYLDGSTQNREEVVNRFRQDENVKLFLISIKAGGVGLNLTEADYVFILDPWWNPAVEQQAVDRTHRIGQSKHVFIYKFITKNSVEEKIVALQERKKTIADSLVSVEESFVKSLTEEDIRMILE